MTCQYIGYDKLHFVIPRMREIVIESGCDFVNGFVIKCVNGSKEAEFDRATIERLMDQNTYDKLTEYVESRISEVLN